MSGITTLTLFQNRLEESEFNPWWRYKLPACATVMGLTAGKPIAKTNISMTELLQMVTVSGEMQRKYSFKAINRLLTSYRKIVYQNYSVVVEHIHVSMDFNMDSYTELRPSFNRKDAQKITAM